jgi:hypothetical protein
MSMVLVYLKVISSNRIDKFIGHGLLSNMGLV